MGMLKNDFFWKNCPWGFWKPWTTNGRAPRWKMATGISGDPELLTGVLKAALFLEHYFNAPLYLDQPLKALAQRLTAFLKAPP